MDGSVNGRVEVSLRWCTTYTPPPRSRETAAEVEPPKSLAVLFGEEEATFFATFPLSACHCMVAVLCVCIICVTF